MLRDRLFFYYYELGLISFIRFESEVNARFALDYAIFEEPLAFVFGMITIEDVFPPRTVCDFNLLSSKFSLQFCDFWRKFVLLSFTLLCGV